MSLTLVDVEAIGVDLRQTGVSVKEQSTSDDQVVSKHGDVNLIL